VVAVDTKGPSAMREIVQRIQMITKFWQSKFHGQDSNRTEQIAEEIVQYAQMIQFLKPGQKVILSAGQIASHFRESATMLSKRSSHCRKGKADLVSKKKVWRMRHIVSLTNSVPPIHSV